MFQIPILSPKNHPQNISLQSPLTIIQAFDVLYRGESGASNQGNKSKAEDSLVVYLITILLHDHTHMLTGMGRRLKGATAVLACFSKQSTSL